MVTTPPTTSQPPTTQPSPIPTGGVIPADLDGFASIVARSLVAVVAAGNVEYIDRILQDAQSSSTCQPFPEIHVLTRAQLDTERALVRRIVREARALERIDGVGRARGRMQEGAEWPGVAEPFVVDVIIAVDCPEA